MTDNYSDMNANKPNYPLLAGLLLAFSLLLAFTYFVVFNAGDSDNDVSVADGGACSTEFAPVCGSNGVTYGNSCMANKENISVACNQACPCNNDIAAGTKFLSPEQGQFLEDQVIDIKYVARVGANTNFVAHTIDLEVENGTVIGFTADNFELKIPDCNDGTNKRYFLDNRICADLGNFSSTFSSGDIIANVKIKAGTEGNMTIKMGDGTFYADANGNEFKPQTETLTYSIVKDEEDTGSENTGSIFNPADGTYVPGQTAQFNLIARPTASDQNSYIVDLQASGLTITDVDTSVNSNLLVIPECGRGTGTTTTFTETSICMEASKFSLDSNTSFTDGEIIAKVTVKFDDQEGNASFTTTSKHGYADNDAIYNQSKTNTYTIEEEGDPLGENPCGKIDIDDSGNLTLPDFINFVSIYKRECTDNTVQYNGCGPADTKRDGVINILDFSRFARSYGVNKTCASLNN